MFENTELFGISMAPRANRRALVVITYSLTAGVIVGCVGLARSIGAIPGHSPLKSPLVLLAWVPIFLVQVVIPGSGNFRGIFGRFVPEQTFSFRRQTIRTLGLARGVEDEQPKADEREMSVRNEAYFLAFKIVAWYAFIFLFGCVGLVSREGEAARTAAAVAAIPIVVMLFTLPQAIILWTEPDLTSE
jgi:hypothetical protein